MKEESKNKQPITRNDYFKKIQELGIKETEKKYDILPLDLSKYHLSETTQRIADANFMEEMENRNGFYMLSGHWLSDLCYQFADKCKFDLTQVDSYSAYAYSDEQMAVFTYTEGDICLTLFENKADYEVEKADTIKFYEEVY